MIVACKNKSNFEKFSGYYGVELGDNKFLVYAIVTFNKKTELEQDTPKRFKAELFTVIDDSYPDYWMSKSWGKHNKIKNKHYDFYIMIESYLGPKEFIENPDFLFDIYENPDRAYQFFYDVLKKYGAL